MVAESKWCPSCGAEYQPYVEHCPDCLVALVTEIELPEVDHSVAEWELHDWSQAQLTGLFAALANRQVRTEWDPHTRTLRASHADEATVDEILALSFTDDTEVGDSLAAFAPPATAVTKIAGLGSRAFSRIIDLMVVQIPTLTLMAYTHTLFAEGEGFSPAAWFVFPAATFLYDFVSVGLWGRTIGKVCTETRVVNASDDAKPSWGRAFVRAGVPALASLVPLANVVVLLVVYGPAWFNDDRQATHDRLARTVVIESERPRRRV